MIPRAQVTAWRARAPESDDAQVEQDLVLARALLEIFRDPLLGSKLVFRGGTALHKLCFDPPGPYSEDIDLVQLGAGPIGPLIDAIRERLDPWLGEPRRATGKGQARVECRFATTSVPRRSMKVKLEINTREHRLSVDNGWFTGAAPVACHAFEELCATKLRALYQRKKGRDLYDLWRARESTDPRLDEALTVSCFLRYMHEDRAPISRARFEANLERKLADPELCSDTHPLLAPDSEFDVASAGRVVLARLVARLPGGARKGEA